MWITASILSKNLPNRQAVEKISWVEILQKFGRGKGRGKTGSRILPIRYFLNLLNIIM